MKNSGWITTNDKSSHQLPGGLRTSQCNCNSVEVARHNCTMHDCSYHMNFVTTWANPTRGRPATYPKNHGGWEVFSEALGIDFLIFCRLRKTRSNLLRSNHLYISSWNLEPLFLVAPKIIISWSRCKNQLSSHAPGWKNPCVSPLRREVFKKLDFAGEKINSFQTFAWIGAAQVCWRFHSPVIRKELIVKNDDTMWL